MSIQTPIRRLAHFMGIDRTIAYTLLGRGWSVLAGPVTLFFIAAYLSPAEQGFYYTFANILGLQVFFELGLSFVILQFASHEMTKLQWTDQGLLVGDASAKGRLSSLFRKALIWYSAVALLALIVLLPTGLYFFGQHQPLNNEINWQLPWMWVVLCSAGALSISPIFAFLEGCGLMADVAFMRIVQSTIGSLLLWLALSNRLGLYATPILSTFALFWGSVWLFHHKRAFIADLWRNSKRGDQISWVKEIWPFQWKIALSWLSGYFIFQLFNPVLFAFHGPVAAGKMGMSLSVIGTISSMSMAWINTKSPLFGNLVANRDFRELDKTFFRCLWQSFILICLGCVALLTVVYLLEQAHHPLGDRFLDLLPLAILATATIVNSIVAAEAIYLRAFKQEPFLGISIFNGIVIGLSTLYFGKAFGAIGMVSGYLTASLIIGLGMGTWIFNDRRRRWQGLH